VLPVLKACTLGTGVCACQASWLCYAKATRCRDRESQNLVAHTPGPLASRTGSKPCGTHPWPPGITHRVKTLWHTPLVPWHHAQGQNLVAHTPGPASRTKVAHTPGPASRTGCRGQASLRSPSPLLAAQRPSSTWCTILGRMEVRLHTPWSTGQM